MRIQRKKNRRKKGKEKTEEGYCTKISHPFGTTNAHTKILDMDLLHVKTMNLCI